MASANILLALVLYGRIIATAHASEPTYLAIAIAITSTLAAMFASYAIQVGILFVAGPLRLTEVLVSFLIAAAQLALFLWPTHVLNVALPTAEAEVMQLRHWLVFYALFAFAGPFANWYAAKMRRLRRPSLIVEQYESSQHKDRTAGFITCTLALGCWGLSFLRLNLFVALGMAIAFAGVTIGMISQARLARRLVDGV